MRNIRVEFEARIPDGASDAQIMEWLMFCLAGTGMETRNPLSDLDLEADWSGIGYKDA